MAVDLKLDNRGDFILSTPKHHDKLRIDWIDSDYPVLRIDFEQGQEVKTRISKTSRIRIDFLTDKQDRVNDRRFETVSDKEELRQRIMILLRTERGEISCCPNVGSYLITQRHEDINSEDVQTMVENIVYSEVMNILENPTVRAVPKKKSGPFFCQNMNVYVYEGTELFFEIEI